MRAALPVALAALLLAPISGLAEAPDEATEPGCRAGQPGYECASKRELWETSVRWKGKAQDARFALLEERISHAATREKLLARTSTAVRDLAVPPPLPQAEQGHSTTILVLASGVALVAGIAFGVLALGSSEPSTIVVK